METRVIVLTAHYELVMYLLRDILFAFAFDFALVPDKPPLDEVLYPVRLSNEAHDALFVSISTI